MGRNECGGVQKTGRRICMQNRLLVVSCLIASSGIRNGMSILPSNLRACEALPAEEEWNEKRSKFPR